MDKQYKNLKMNNLTEEIKLFTDNLIQQVVNVVPNIILALIVLVIGLGIAFIGKRLIKRFIVFLHNSLNKILKYRGIEVDLKNSLKIAGIAVFWIIVVFTVALIAQVLELTFIAGWFEGLIRYLPKIIAALFIIISGYILGKIVSDLIITLTTRIKIGNAQSIGLLVKYIIFFTSVVIAINQIGIDIAFLVYLILLVLGLLLFGVVLTFAIGAKTSVNNIISSYYVQKTYHIGDVVKIRDTKGKIVEITSTSVILKTDSGKLVIPAKDFNNEEVLILEEQ